MRLSRHTGFITPCSNSGSSCKPNWQKNVTSRRLTAPGKHWRRLTVCQAHNEQCDMQDRRAEDMRRCVAYACTTQQYEAVPTFVDNLGPSSSAWKLWQQFEVHAPVTAFTVSRTIPLIPATAHVQKRLAPSAIPDAWRLEKEEPGPLMVHHVHKRLPIQTLALGSDSECPWYYCGVRGDPRGYWCEGVPMALHNKLKSSGPATTRPRVAHLAFREDAWFVRFQDNTSAWSVYDFSARLQSELEKGFGSAARSVCFGPGGSYLVLTDDGGVHGHELPGHMGAKVEEAMQQHGGVAHATMGPDGGWFIQCTDGHTLWDTLDPTLDRVLRSAPTRGRGQVLRLWLGPSNTYVVECMTSTLWRATSDLSDRLLAAFDDQ